MGDRINIPTFGHVTLTESINNMQTVPSFARQKLFPREITHPTTSVMLDIIVGGKKIAPFVKRGNPAKVISNLGQKTQEVTPPSIRVKKFLKPSDLSLRQAGNSIFVPGAAGQDPLEAARKVKIANEQKDQKDVIDRTIEYMCFGALAGAYTITQDDLQFSIDFGMPSANKPTLSGGAKWDAPSTCKPLNNLRTWRGIAHRASGKIPTIVMYTTATFEKFLESADTVKYLDLKKIDLGSVKTDKLELEMGAIKVAEIDGMTHYIYEGSYVDAAGEEKTMIPDGVVILASPTADNRIHFGLIEEIQFTMAKYFSKDKVEDDPSGLWLISESDPLPACHQPDSNIYATVF